MPDISDMAGYRLINEAGDGLPGITADVYLSYLPPKKNVFLGYVYLFVLKPFLFVLTRIYIQNMWCYKHTHKRGVRI